MDDKLKLMEIAKDLTIAVLSIEAPETGASDRAIELFKTMFNEVKKMT